MNDKITPKQYAFIQSLRRQLQYSEDWEHDKKLTKIQASYLIKKLLTMLGYDWKKF